MGEFGNILFLAILFFLLFCVGHLFGPACGVVGIAICGVILWGVYEKDRKEDN